MPSSHGWGNGDRTSSRVRIRHRAVDIRVISYSGNNNFGVWHGSGGFHSAGVGFEIIGDVFKHLHIHASVINHAFTIKNVASGGVRDKQDLLIILSAFAAGDFKFNRKLRGAHVFIKARPNHVARRGNVWRFRELSKHLVGRQAHVDGR